MLETHMIWDKKTWDSLPLPWARQLKSEKITFGVAPSQDTFGLDLWYMFFVNIPYMEDLRNMNILYI